MINRRKCEDFIENNIRGYNISKHFYKGKLVSIVIKGGLRGKDVHICDEYHFNNIEDSDDICALGMNTLEEALDSRSEDMKEMILYFLDRGAIKDYFYYDFGEGKCIEKIPDVKNLEEWEEEQLIPILENFELFGIGSDTANLRQCNHLIKGSRPLEFITDVIDTYGYIKFGDMLEVGKIEMTDKEYEELKELW